MQNSGGGGMGMGMGMQDMQRFQQQLQAQYQRQQQQQQQQQQQGGAGGPNAALVGNNQQAFGQFVSGGMNPNQNRGTSVMNNTALAMMQQQQQQQQQQNQHQQQQNIGGMNMQGPVGNMPSVFGSFGNMNQSMLQQQQQQQQQGGGGSSMDASNSSSARLMAMANMGQMGGNAARSMDTSSTSAMQNMQAIMQQQPNVMNPFGGMQMQGQQQGQGQGQNPQQSMFNQMGGMAAQANQLMQQLGNSGQMSPQQQMMLQQQLANLQQQMQQSQQQNNMQANMGNRAAPGNQMLAAAAVQGQNNSVNLLQQRQQQLLQQMQNQQRANGLLNQPGMGAGGVGAGAGAPAGLNINQGIVGGPGGDMNSMNNMMQQMMQQHGMANINTQQQQNALNAFQQQQFGGAFARGPLTDAQLNMRQRSILRASNEAQGMAADAMAAAAVGPAPLDGSSCSSSNNVNNNNNNNLPFNMDGSAHGIGQQQQQQQQQRGSILSSTGGGGGGGGMNDGSGRGGNVNNNMIMQQQQQQQQQLDTSTHSNSNRGGSVMGQQPSVQQNGGLSGSARGSSASAAASAALSQAQKSFLDGNFAGGWQSNSDLPDRRKVIFSILEVIKQMRPNTNTTSTKLPHMAKSLEEHLYRSAQTKEEYLDPATLKQRLQTIAQGLDSHRAPGAPPIPGNVTIQAAFGQMDTSRSSSHGDGNHWNNNNNNNNNQNQIQNMLQQAQQHQQMMGGNMQAQGNSNVVDPWGGSQNSDHGSSSIMGNLQQQQQDALGNRQQSTGWSNSTSIDMNNNSIRGDDSTHGNPPSFMSQMSSLNGTNDQAQVMSGGGGQGQVVAAAASAGGNDANMLNPEYPNTPKYQDAEAAQKRKVILQQQQRLLLLRHASKCKNGPTCPTKFCSQMVTLWRHMKTCRDKNCKTSHCLSSRCVLNHYRICKSQGKTATCEVCGPVMAKIKQNGRDEVASGDPLSQSQQTEQSLQQNMPQQQQQQQQQQAGMASLAARMMSLQRAQANATQGPNGGGAGAGAGLDTVVGGMNQMNGMNQMSFRQGNNMQGNIMMGNNNMMGMMNQQGNNLRMPAANLTDEQIEQNQLQQLQQHQAKMQQQLESLRELQRQQQQLLDQQGRLQEQAQLIQDVNSPQAQQLRQQQMLLDQLQKRCQQQQLRLQQEIELQSNTNELTQALEQQVPAPVEAASVSAPSQQVGLDQSDNGMPQINPPELSRQASITSISNSGGMPGMDDSSSRRKRRASATEKPARRNSGKAKRAPAGGGKGKAFRQQLQESRASESQQVNVANLRMENFAKKKAMVQSNPEERAQKRSKVELAPLAGETSSLVSYMDRGTIMRHLESLNKSIRLSARTVTHKCLPVVQALIDDQFGWVFHDPVDPVALGLPDYYEVVMNPMHLALVKKKLENAIYSDIDLFARDVRLVFENAILYNGETSEVGELAQTMLQKFDNLFKDLMQGVESSQRNLETSGQACSLCGNQTRRFEPAILYCRGRCGMQRIKRGATYYTERTKSNHWCQSCYASLRPKDRLVLDDGTEVGKEELFEFKNDALPEEPWVSCDECQSWVHQVCALFNGRTNRTNANYTCPNCILKRGDITGFPVSGKKFTKGALDLERCKMSDAIEDGVHAALQDAYAERAKELGVDYDTVEKAEGLAVRVLSSVEKKHHIGERMVRRYESSGCPTELPVRSKCIALFQNIHGVDTMLFAMYVYEYDQNCPAPNRRRVYISYLDSVQYFEPKCYRTLVYQSIFKEYLRYVKGRGFHTAHIWSCPPTPGDDYIFFIHPSHQLFPREDMLRGWYHKALEKAKAEGIVIRTSSLFDEYFNSETAPPEAGPREDPLCLPYFEGDYIPGEIENIIRQLDEKGMDRSQDGPDEVMARLKQNIGKMKENFIVVHLRNRRFAAAVENGEDVSDWPEDSDEALVRSKRAIISGKEARRSWPGGPALNPLSDGGFGAKSDEFCDDRKNPANRSLCDMELAVSGHLAKLNRQPGVVGDTSDEDPSIESDLFESRQQFLNYCQTNHCQFDELRRSKHSTLMVLFQLHNPTAPKFLQQCSACYRDITHGFRYHCNNCKNFDLCGDCYEPVTSGSCAQKDDRFKHDKSHTFTPIDLESADESNKNGEERQEALKAHIELLEHAGTCSGSPGCQLQNCEKMKRLFEHVKTCDVKPKTGCKICTRLLSLCVLHARLCPVKGECPIPFCDKIRDRNQRVRRQQQLMDERRRQAQNELYYAGGEVEAKVSV